MEMGKLTAKLRDAVPVCLLVEGKEIKRYKNLDIPDELKKLEYQDFKFDVPLNGVITFKIMFESGVLPEDWPLVRKRKTRRPTGQEAQSQEAAPETDVLVEAEPQPQDARATEVHPTSAVQTFAQALEDSQAVGELVAGIAAVMTDGAAIKPEIIEGEDKGRLVVITVEPANMEIPKAPESILEAVDATAEAETQPEAKNPTRKGKGKKGTVATEDE